MKKTILDLEGVQILSKTQQKNTFGGLADGDPGDLISGSDVKWYCSLPFGMVQSDESCILACGNQYLLHSYYMCKHHN